MKDLFSNQAKEYASFRPSYPAGLYDFVYGHLKNFDVAWDAGTGNGQVAVDLARRFKKVLATDISARQLQNARKLENIFYAEAGEVADFPACIVDLVTVGQAIHWFDRPKFYAEVKRVATPDAWIAVWGYALLSIQPDIDDLVQHFYTRVVGPYWDPERKLIDSHFRDLDFPFAEVSTPPFEFSFEWTLEELQGYLGTWSAVQKYIGANAVDPVPALMRSVQPLAGKARLKVTFPLFLRMGRIS